MMPLLLDPNSPLQQTEIGKLISSGDPEDGEAAFQIIISSASTGQPVDYLVDPKIMKTAWQGQVDAANKHYEPGKFTTLVAYEWSSQPNSQNLHHNVFFRDSGELLDQPQRQRLLQHDVRPEQIRWHADRQGMGRDGHA
jgi:hypothetical protein